MYITCKGISVKEQRPAVVGERQYSHQGINQNLFYYLKNHHEKYSAMNFILHEKRKKQFYMQIQNQFFIFIIVIQLFLKVKIYSSILLALVI